MRIKSLTNLQLATQYQSFVPSLVCIFDVNRTWLGLVFHTCYSHLHNKINIYSPTKILLMSKWR